MKENQVSMPYHLLHYLPRLLSEPRSDWSEFLLRILEIAG